MAIVRNKLKEVIKRLVAMLNAVIITALSFMPFLQTVSYAEPAGSEANAGRSLGEYRVTYYTYEDNDDGAGHFGTTATASGNPATPHHTAAIDIVAHTNGTDAHGIKMGDRVRIGDEIYTVEDYGSGPDKSTFKEGVDEFIDIFVDPSDGTELPPDYAEVFLLDGTEGESTSTEDTGELNLLSYIEIAGDENTGYYYKFVDNIDDVIQELINEDFNMYKTTGLTVNKIKTMMKAALVTQLPDLGGAPYDTPQIDLTQTIEFIKLPDDISNSTNGSTVSSGSSTNTVYASNTGFEWPVQDQTTASDRASHITSLVGHRESPGGIGSTNHQGMDISCASGTPIVATAPGTVEIAGDYGGLGNAVVINHGTVNGKTMKSTYGHNTSVTVNVGDQVQKGQVIAYAGSTGNSTGPHCHFQINFEGDSSATDPLHLFTADQVSGTTASGVQVSGDGLYAGVSTGGGFGLTSLDGVLMVGDSITEGMQGYHANGDVNCIFRGVGGWTSQKWLDNFSRLTGISGVKGINIMLGANDCLLDPDESLKDLKELIEKLHAEYPNVHIFVDKCLPMNGGGQENWTKYNNGIEKLGLSYVTAIDVSANIEYDQDNIHPTANGSKTLFKNITEKVRASGASASASNVKDLGANLPTVDNFITERKANRFYDANTFNGTINLRRVSVNKNPGEIMENAMQDKPEEGEKEYPENRGTAEEVPQEIRNLIAQARGVNTINYDNFRYLRIPYRNFDDDIKIGTMIVQKDIADEVLDIFYELYAMKYPIQNMQELEKYYLADQTITSRASSEAREETKVAVLEQGGGGGGDKTPSTQIPAASAANVVGVKDLENAAQLDNDTFAYLYGGDDNHETGMAIDLNTFINPKIVNGNAVTKTSNMFLSRNKDDIKNTRYEEMQQEALITEDSEVVKIFEKYGWKWSGTKENPDYAHFEKVNFNEEQQVTYLETKVQDMLFVSRGTFDKLVSENDQRALNVFTMDQNNVPKFASWDWSQDEGYKINSGKTVNVKNAIKKYAMPYELILAIAVQTKDPDFTVEFAKLALNSQYLVAIEDKITTKKEVTTTTKTITWRLDDEGNAKTSDERTEVNSSTIMKESATPKPELTFVDGWYIKYTKDTNFLSVPSGGTIVAKGTITVSSSPPVVTSRESHAEGDNRLVTTTTQKQTDTYEYNFETGNEYISGNAERFLEIYEDSTKYKAISSIYIPWLSTMLDMQETTVDLVDVMKYLCYQGRNYSNYGLSYLKFSDYMPDDFDSKSNGGGKFGDDYGDWNGGTHEEFIQAVAPYAIMIRDKYGIYPSVCIAQAIQESGWGTSSLALNQHNFFGMKGSPGTGNEYWGGEAEGGWKTYDCLKNSVFDYGLNLATNELYPEIVRTAYSQGLGPKTQLEALGPTYCSSDYASVVYQLIEQYDLTKYDTMSLSDFTPVSSSSTGGKQKVLELARTKIGCSYVRGAEGPDTFDCTGLCYWAYQQIGITLPRSTSDYYNSYRGTAHEITWDEAQPGDILIIRDEDGKGSIGWSGGHAALYTGGDGLIEAVESGVREVNQGAHSRFAHVFRFD